jgi:hypothetical protein
VRAALDDSKSAHDEAARQKAVLDNADAQLAALVAAGAKDDDDVKIAARLAWEVEQAAQAIDGAATRAGQASARAIAAAGAPAAAEAQPLVAEADAHARASAGLAAQGKDMAARARKSADAFTRAETGDASMYLSTGEAALASGNLGEAKKYLEKAAKAYKAAKKDNPAVDFAFGRLYDKLADGEKDGAARAKLLGQAKTHYAAFAARGAGARVNVAKERLGEIDEELAESK